MDLKFKKEPFIKKSDYLENAIIKLENAKTKEEIELAIKEKALAKLEYKFDKKVNIIPKVKNRLIVIMLNTDQSILFRYRKLKIKTSDNYFIYRKGLYFIENDGIYTDFKGKRYSIYDERCSIPLKPSIFKTKTEIIEFTDIYGKKQTVTVNKIEGLPIDAKTLETFINERFAEVFTKIPMKSLEYILLILGIITCVMVGIGYALIYFLR